MHEMASAVYRDVEVVWQRPLARPLCAACAAQLLLLRLRHSCRCWRLLCQIQQQADSTAAALPSGCRQLVCDHHHPWQQQQLLLLLA
jgi:hypothetical protein